MSKQAQFDAAEQQQFLPVQAGQIQDQISFKPLYGHPHVAYPSMPVLNVIAGESDEDRRERATCCSPCWAIFIAIAAGIALCFRIVTLISCINTLECTVVR